MVNVCFNVSWYEGSSAVKLKFCRRMTTTSKASCQANGLPMQARAPLPNGFQQLGNSLLSRSNSASSILSGRHASASSPYTTGSRCTFGRKAIIGSPCAKLLGASINLEVYLEYSCLQNLVFAANDGILMRLKSNSRSRRGEPKRFSQN